MLPQTKNGDGRIVRLNDLAAGVLAILPPGAPTDRIFPLDVEPEAVSLAFLRACRKIGIDDFKLHDLRHTNASWMRMKGADLQEVADALGHRDLRMTRRYAHLSEEHLLTAVKRLDRVFMPLKLGHDEVTIEGQNSTKRLQTGARLK